jgi:hypothetical protein
MTLFEITGMAWLLFTAALAHVAIIAETYRPDVRQD